MMNFLIGLSRWRKLATLHVVSVGLNIRSLSVGIQACRLTRGPVGIHLLFVKHLDFLGILHVNCRVIMLRLLLALRVIIPGRILLLLTAIVRLVANSLTPINICIVRLLRCSGLFVNRL